MSEETVVGLKGGQQLGLGMEIEDGFYQREQPAAIYTAARFRSNRPDDYAECVKLLGQAVPVERIKRLLRIHHETVRAVVERERLTVGELKEITKRGLREAVAMFGAQAGEELSRLRGLPKFIAGGIVLDKLAQMEGEPTIRVEHTIKGAAVDWNKINAGPFADVIEVPAGEPEARGQKSEVRIIQEVGVRSQEAGGGQISQPKPNDENT